MNAAGGEPVTACRPHILRWFANWLHDLADRICPRDAYRASAWSFTFEPGEGARLRTDARGCRLWYRGMDTYERATAESDTARAHTTGSRPVNPDRACPHGEFHLFGDVNRVVRDMGDTVPVGYFADVQVRCTQCGEPFRWTGLRAGMNPAYPTCSVDERILCAPIRPASADPDFGLGLPGFAIRYRDPAES